MNLDSNTLNQKVKLEKIHEKWGVEADVTLVQRPPKNKGANGKRMCSSSSLGTTRTRRGSIFTFERAR